MKNLNRRSFSQVHSSYKPPRSPCLPRSWSPDRRLQQRCPRRRSRFSMGAGGDHNQELGQGRMGAPHHCFCATPDRGPCLTAGPCKGWGGGRRLQPTYVSLLESKNVDAISIATPPNHWPRPLGTIWAIQAGKDVYVEKNPFHTMSAKAAGWSEFRPQIRQDGSDRHSKAAPPFRALKPPLPGSRKGILAKSKWPRGPLLQAPPQHWQGPLVRRKSPGGC